MNIYEIARIAGVSVGTVSRVINGKRDVSRTTRAKILKIMDDTGYMPKISSSRGNTIALFVPLNKSRKISSPYLARTLSGIGDCLFDNDFRMLIVSTYNLPHNDFEFLQYCLKNNIDGGIFVLSSLSDTYIPGVAEKLPIVVVGNHFESARLTSVSYDARKASQDAVRHLIDLGHRRILFIYMGIDFYDTANRLAGYRNTLASHGIFLEDRWMLGYDEISDEDLTDYIERALQWPEAPTAMLIQNDTQALRVMNILSQKSVRIPEEMSIIGFDDLSFAQYATPPLTTISQPIYDEGLQAAREIMAMLEEGHAYACKKIVLDSRMVMRGTVTCARVK